MRRLLGETSRGSVTNEKPPAGDGIFFHKTEKLRYNEVAKQNQITPRMDTLFLWGGLFPYPFLQVRINEAKMLAPLTCERC